jgi:4-hydroxythreonine-4-phosphate dehydrogenase
MDWPRRERMNNTTGHEADFRPILGISVGDPGGIGPEVTAKALAREEIYRLCRPLVVSDLRVVEEALRITGLDLGIHQVSSPAEGIYRHGALDVLHIPNMPAQEIRYGKVTPWQGEASFQYVAKVIELAMAGEIHGTVTGPIHKEAINAAGHHFAGHTEIYAQMTSTRDYAMMLAHGSFRVVHVSTHVSLREACESVKKERILRVIQLSRDALGKLGIQAPRIGVAALNPHAGEGGLFGKEEQEQIGPAVEEAKKKGILAEGPIPADTVFSKMLGGMYDLVVVMYHDQGHIPVKLVGFRYDEKTGTWAEVSGVNITLGLPIVRASVDHGTAFGKAGKGTANPQSMVEAIRMAALLARR